MKLGGKVLLTAGFAVIGALLPTPARSQWMRLQRCGAALPCAIPFGVRYAPDPLIATAYGRVSPDAFSGRVSFEPKLALEIDQPRISLEPADFAAQAARRFVLAHPPPPSSEQLPKLPE